ncbi:hypothetical protein ACIA8F_26050 [Streptomyces sp. NPDC051563]
MRCIEDLADRGLRGGWARAVVRAAEAGRVGLRGLERAGGDVLSGLEA